jgi:LacI family transcriptional regulator
MSDVTIYDVAAQAGVSISTVSRVLNTPGQVQEQTRTRVLAAIDALNFVPRADATARARKGTGRIGVLAPFFTYPSFVQRLRGVAEALANTPYELVIYNVDTSIRRDAYLESLPVTRRLDGLIVMSLAVNAVAAQRLLNHTLEVVLIEYAHSNFSSIEIDNVHGGEMVADFFVSRGHQRFGFVGDSEVPEYALFISGQRFDGYQRRLREHGLALHERHVGLTHHGREYARQKTHQIMNHDQPPTAIFASSDTQAMGALQAIRERGLRVPHDVAIVGFDDIDIAGYIGLTTVRQPLEESGRAAVEQLLAQIEDRSRPVRRVNLELQIIQRETA